MIRDINRGENREHKGVFNNCSYGFMYNTRSNRSLFIWRMVCLLGTCSASNNFCCNGNFIENTVLLGGRLVDVIDT